MNAIPCTLRPDRVRLTALAFFMCSWSAAAVAQPAACSMKELATVPLTFTDDMRPLVEARINGHPVPAMLNIGSQQGAVLNKKTLDQLGVQIRHITSTQFRDEAEGARHNSLNPTMQQVFNRAMYSFVDDFSFGPTNLKKKTYLVEDFFDDSFGVRLGAKSILQQDVEFALDAGHLKYFKNDGCGASHLAYWDPQAIAVSVANDPQKREARPMFQVRINGKDAWAVLSTATPHSYIPTVVAERLGLTPASPGAKREDPLPGDGLDKPIWNVPVAQVAIGDLQVSDLDLRLIDLSHSGESLVLGADFMHRYRIYVAMSQNKIYFSQLAAPRTLKRGSVDVILDESSSPQKN